ncbi:MAG: cysteine hydrolase [Syntrophus sp. (in: bacteria)]|nr:cysteine hydrolase [Syntrophus sp. (in: bacteria)]
MATTKENTKIDAKKTAIVLIEPQYDFLKPGGSMYQFIAEQLEKRKVIENLADLVKKARSKVKKIIYIPFEAFEPGFPEIDPKGPGMGGLRGLEIDMPTGWKLGGKKVFGAWVAGTPGPEIIPELTPKKGDIIVRGKKTLDAFWSTALDYTLRVNMIEHVAIVGFHTNWCVESTARSAYDHGYRVIVIGDCTGTDTDEEQNYAEKFIFPKIGLVMKYKEFLKNLA